METLLLREGAKNPAGPGAGTHRLPKDRCQENSDEGVRLAGLRWKTLRVDLHPFLPGLFLAEEVWNRQAQSPSLQPHSQRRDHARSSDRRVAATDLRAG